MKLSSETLKRLCELACAAAQGAGHYVAGRVDEELTVSRKAEASTLASGVVTEVDIESQKRIIEILAPSLSNYDLGLLAEESADDSSRLEKDYFWCIDPLDGTLPFTEGRAGYAVSIALVSRNGDSIIGVVYDPVEKCLYSARQGHGAFRNGKAWKPEAAHRRLEPGWLALVTDRSFSLNAELEGILVAKAKRRGLHGLKVLCQGGAAMNALWVAENSPAVYPKFAKEEPGGGSLWDFAATNCIFGELGLSVSDMMGNPLNMNPKGSTFMNEGGTLYATERELASLFIEASGGNQ